MPQRRRHDGMSVKHRNFIEKGLRLVNNLILRAAGAANPVRNYLIDMSRIIFNECHEMRAMECIRSC